MDDCKDYIFRQNVTEDIPHLAKPYKQTKFSFGMQLHHSMQTTWTAQHL